MLNFNNCKKMNITLPKGEDFSLDYLVSSDVHSFLNCDKYTIIPGFCDVHVHFREPGFVYKETIESGSKSAVRGGYVSVCTMPNLKPAPDSLENFNIQKEKIDEVGLIDIFPYGTITKEQRGAELSEMEELSKVAVAFSDDGKGIQTEELMRLAMTKAKELEKMIVAHCEDESLLHGGYIHDGEYAKKNGHKGISSESEYKQIERDLKLAKEIGCKYHICHISTKESVELIRRAKCDGVDVSCETAPHYLVFDDSYLQEEGRFKMNPPLRGREDREALIEGIIDGTIDMIATDHAPHSLEEKSKGLKDSAFGIVGLETAFPVLYTHLVKKNIISLEKLVELMAINPRQRFGLPLENSFSVWDLNEEYLINSDDFLSMGKSTPFENMKVYGKNLLTVHNGKIVYNNIGR